MKDILKKKITIFIIGLLVGAILSTGCFVIYSKAHFKNNNHGNRPAMMNGNSTGMPSGTPLSMPSNDQNGTSNQNSNQGQPPAMPGQNTNNTQTTNSNS